MKGTLDIIIFTFFLNWALANDVTEPSIYKTESYKYFIETENKCTWSEALEECKNKDMNLVTINSEEKADDVHLVINEAFLHAKRPVPRLYIGANDLDEFRKFKWVATNDPFGYTNWEKPEPNNYHNLNERCVHMGYHGTEQWNDINCERKYGFICEQLLGVEDLSVLVPKA